ncbi:hypothetical protein GCM10022419_131790 [Nonomuraea rosea]|uniref:Uncharacterized protein n=1 Tax=Nonomuraea rosea TaxID=638574 RepID=A0ABP7A2R9_9ACTN
MRTLKTAGRVFVGASLTVAAGIAINQILVDGTLSWSWGYLAPPGPEIARARQEMTCMAMARVDGIIGRAQDRALSQRLASPDMRTLPSASVTLTDT